ncbi:HCNGP domain-containing protein [Venturia nashicola]|uniref:HCNGP-domain-containing protein n=1 Tax=Venturia nashicola TaxID=86259 RepID=A0A4Z1PVW0_9PEZI|nr:HCNGP-domain-containing protein [Venturia nashicola]TLD39095.1 HCNGP domain-containing protein [Venturia nashicola]
MPPLVAYGSSDEEENDDIPQENIESEAPPPTASSKKARPEPVPSLAQPTAALPAQDARPQRPALGPSMPLRPNLEPILGSDSAPQSPYTASRLSIRDLTMPPVPNFNIPPSPPGSPPLAATKRFTRFLELKKQGIHFNAKLETSSALKNPNLLPKLRQFAGIDEKDSLATALPEGLAVPTSFPAWAYTDQLNKTQQVVKKKKEEEQAQKQRESIDFVPATASGASSRNATPGVIRGSSSISERVMAGLNREKHSMQGTGKRKDDRNGGQAGVKRSRFDERPR